jgi:hypothetical protein
MRAKQCLLLAQRASLQMGGDGLSIRNNAQFVGLKFSPLRVVNDYAVTQLTAGATDSLPLGYGQIGKITQTVPIETFLASVTETAKRSLKEHQQEFRRGTNGFLILRVVSWKKALNCRYELEVYALLFLPN